MNKIILVRHTEKEEGFDLKITEKGQLQAVEIANFLIENKHQYDHVFTSVYRRSIKSAEIINEQFKKPSSMTMSFNEYYVRPSDKKDIEMPDTAMSRAMSKIYAISDIFQSIMIVSHNSINTDILQTVLNLDYDESRGLFKHYGDTVVLRYDNSLGDKNWRIVDKFTPKQ